MISGSMSNRLRSQLQVVDQPPVDQLVTRLHVGERRVVEHVRGQRQEAVADPVQEQHVAALTGEARPVHHQRPAAEDRVRAASASPRGRTRGRRPARARVAGRVLEAGAHRRALALVALRACTTRTVLSPSCASTSRVPSVLPSSTTMISRSMPSGSSTARMRRMISTTVLRSLKTGTTTESLRSFGTAFVTRGHVRRSSRYQRIGARKPSRRSTFGSQPSSSRARVMSGRRRVGSPTGSGSNTISRARTGDLEHDARRARAS